MIENVIKKRIEELGVAQKVNVINESNLHVGHLNEGKGHFCIELINLISNQYTRIKLHIAIYVKLADLMDSKIHALSIKIKGEI